MSGVDLRHEPGLGARNATAAAYADDRESFLREMTRQSSRLSENAQRFVDEFRAGDVEFAAALRLADRIEAGDAKEDEAEHDLLYRQFPKMVDRVIDLFLMVARRDEQIAFYEADEYDRQMAD